MKPAELLEFLAMAEKLKCNTRHSYTSSGRHESVAEHSFRLALMAYMVSDEVPEIDTDKVIRMCLIHDLGEAITGDIPSFEKTDSDEAAEDSAVSGFVNQLPEYWKKQLGEMYSEMNELKTPEAKLYKALDKLEAVIQHNEADISTWLPLEYDLQLTYGTEECSFNEYINSLRDEVRSVSEKKIKDNR
ncbi:MAG: HD domain-containing protein [Anaerovoracaceae bacterium]|nr:HD domain-containing protein [Anaerovoracaceae bacterium]